MFLKFRIQYGNDNAFNQWRKFTEAYKSKMWFGSATRISPDTIEVECDDPSVSMVEAHREQLVQKKLTQRLVDSGHDIIEVVLK